MKVTTQFDLAALSPDAFLRATEGYPSPEQWARLMAMKGAIEYAHKRRKNIVKYSGSKNVRTSIYEFDRNPSDILT